MNPRIENTAAKANISIEIVKKSAAGREKEIRKMGDPEMYCEVNLSLRKKK